ncbi:hypothetical protein [Cryobacterium sp. TMT1-62]|uniref:hypothetical protein n=1 Tax=Cryobacterium sp. TMT1-62 TaxID=1259240 RepID=UPI0018E0BBB3|nr:hypothetical protein [Cryobacterium sp. TMT1-62]
MFHFYESSVGTSLARASTAWKRVLALLVVVAVVGVGGTGLGGAAVAGSLPQSPVELGTADSFAILSKTGVTNVYASAVNGNVGASPITGDAVLLTCPEVMTGTISLSTPPVRRAR